MCFRKMPHASCPLDSALLAVRRTEEPESNLKMAHILGEPEFLKARCAELDACVSRSESFHRMVRKKAPSWEMNMFSASLKPHKAPIIRWPRWYLLRNIFRVIVPKHSAVRGETSSSMVECASEVLASFQMEICTSVGLFLGGLFFNLLQFWFCAKPPSLDALFCWNYTAAPRRHFAEPRWAENSNERKTPKTALSPHAQGVPQDTETAWKHHPI